MDIQFYGANCVVLNTKGVRVVIDDNLVALGGRPVLKPGDIALYTSRLIQDGAGQAARDIETKLTVEHAGEYEISDISIYGIPARAHMDEEDRMSATMYKIIAGELNVFISGHIYPELSEDQLEEIGMIDIMCVPVGGNGYTLDPVGALKVIKKIEPKIIIPTHYDGGPAASGGTAKALNFDMPQQTLDQALTALSMEAKETTAKLRVKSTELPQIATLVVLERS